MGELFTSQIKGFDESVERPSQVGVEEVDSDNSEFERNMKLIEKMGGKIVADRKVLHHEKLSDSEVEFEAVTFDKEFTNAGGHIPDYSDSIRIPLRELFPLSLDNLTQVERRTLYSEEDFRENYYKGREQYYKAREERRQKISEYLYSEGSDVVNLKWLQHESWKAGKLITPVHRKAVGMIAKELRSPLYFSYSGYALIKVLAKYILCNRDLEVFKDFVKLEKSGVFYKFNLDKKQFTDKVRLPYLSRIAKPKYTYYDESKAYYDPYREDKKYRYGYGNGIYTRSCVALDKTGKALNSPCYNLLLRPFISMSGMSKYSNANKYLYQKYVRQDEAAAEVFKARIDKSYDYSKCSLHSNYSKLIRVNKGLDPSYEKIINEVSNYYDGIIPVYAEYLKQGRIALIDFCISQGYAPTDMLIVTDATAIENEKYSLRQRDEVVINAILSLNEQADARYGLSDTHNSNTALRSILDNLDMIISSKPGNKLYPNKVLYTHVNEQGKYETTSHEHIKHKLFEVPNIQKVVKVLSALESYIR